MTHSTLIGNLVADAEMRTTSTGKTVLDFRFAVNEPKRKDGKPDDPPTYWRASLLREDADIYAGLLTKGTRVVVVGRPRVREFERSDGTKGFSAEVVFPVVGIVPPRERTSSGGYSAAPAAASYDPWAVEQQQPTEAPF